MWDFVLIAGLFIGVGIFASWCRQRGMVASYDEPQPRKPAAFEPMEMDSITPAESGPTPTLTQLTTDPAYSWREDNINHYE